MTDEERIISCQQEIRRLRGVVRECEIPSENQSGLNVVKQYLNTCLY